MRINFTLLKSFVFTLAFLLPLAGISLTNYKGKIHFNDNKKTPLKGVVVMLKDFDGSVVVTTVTNEDGEFFFEGVEEGKYILDASYDHNFSGVDLQDLFIVMKHLSGIKELEGLKYLAADVDGNGVIDWNDYWDYIDWFVKGKEFKVGKWVFEKVELDLSSSMKEDFEDEFPADGAGNSGGGGVFEPGGKSLASGIDIIFDGKIKKLANDELIIPVTYKGSEIINGYNFALEIKNKNVQVLEVISDLSGLEYNIENNVLKLTWFDAGLTGADMSNIALFNIRVKTTEEAIDVKNIFGLMDDSHIININGERLDDVQIAFPEGFDTGEGTSLNDIYPNPVASVATIKYKIAHEAKVTLTIYNTFGQKIKELVNAVQSPDTYTVEFNVNELNLSSGMYIYKLDCMGAESFTESKMLIVN